MEYAYDAAGNRARLTYPDGYYVTYSYDAPDRPTEVRENGTTLLAQYGYDPLSRGVSIIYERCRTYSYKLDAI